MFTDIQQAINWVTSRRKSDHHFGDFSAYLASKGNPQLQLKCIHVAGTNGKGSTTNYLRNILQQKGYKVGWFTSPHLVTHLDRIRINDDNIDSAYFLQMVNQYYDEFIQQDLSMFEIDMFISIYYFLDKQVDYCVYEVGLGGRLDSTNVIRPLVAVITNIEMDHMAILGDNITKIAYEKAGIIKDNIPVVTFEKKPEALDVFKEICQKHHSELILTSDIKNLNIDDHLEYDYKDYHVSLNTLASYQSLNSSLAIETSEVLNRYYDFGISKQEILTGLDTFWLGRFEKMSADPLVYVDGAHNENGIDKLCQSLDFIKRDKVIIFSALADKEYHKMLKKLISKGEVVVTQFENSRSTSAENLALGFDVKVIDDYRQAIQYGLASNKMVIITGSLYFVSLVREYFQKC